MHVLQQVLADTAAHVPVLSQSCSRATVRDVVQSNLHHSILALVLRRWMMMRWIALQTVAVAVIVCCLVSWIATNSDKYCIVTMRIVAVAAVEYYCEALSDRVQNATVHRRHDLHLN